MAFEKIKLATGELRGEYIERRLVEKATVKAIVAEINAAGMYSGPEGKSWPDTVVYAVKRKLDRAKTAKPADAEDTAAPGSGAVDTLVSTVAAKHEGILTEADMKEINAEAAAELRKSQRKQARKEALAAARQKLEQEAHLAEQRGTARRDMVDVHIDLAPYAPDIRLDGKVFRHGTMRRVPRDVASVLYEQMQRSWNHQEGLQGKNENAYRRSFEQRRREGNLTAGVAGPPLAAVR